MGAPSRGQSTSPPRDFQRQKGGHSFLGRPHPDSHGSHHVHRRRYSTLPISEEKGPYVSFRRVENDKEKDRRIRKRTLLISSSLSPPPSSSLASRLRPPALQETTNSRSLLGPIPNSWSFPPFCTSLDVVSIVLYEIIVILGRILGRRSTWRKLSGMIRAIGPRRTICPSRQRDPRPGARSRRGSLVRARLPPRSPAARRRWRGYGRRGMPAATASRSGAGTCSGRGGGVPAAVAAASVAVAGSRASGRR